MIHLNPPIATDAVQDQAVKDQAMVWITRLASGHATEADAEALRRWRDASAAHRQAFAEAKLLWEVLGPAAEDAQRATPRQTMGSTAGSIRLGRRAVMGGALAAASVAAVGYVGAKPPFRLWPSLGELRADYRTMTGERRQLALADDISLILNTQTSIGVGSTSPAARVIELISGEAAISTRAMDQTRFDVVAANGRTSAIAARFDLRRDDATVRVTCLDGGVNVTCHDRSLTVPPGHQVTYDAQGLRDVAPVDTAVVTAWQQGQLIFRHEPLARVIAEVNRYRPGRILLLNTQMGERDVVATFHLNRIDEVVTHLAQAFNMRARFLPGDLVVLS